jgi:Ca2+/Na+ antiporter
VRRFVDYDDMKKPLILAAGCVICLVVGVVALLVAIDIRQTAPGTTGFMPGLPFALMSAVLIGFSVVAGILAWIEFAAARESEVGGGR